MQALGDAKLEALVEVMLLAASADGDFSEVERNHFVKSVESLTDGRIAGARLETLIKEASVALESDGRELHRHRSEAGRDKEPFEIIVSMGSSPEIIARCADAGVSTCNVGPSVKGLRGTKDDFVDWIKRFSDEVIAKA